MSKNNKQVKTDIKTDYELHNFVHARIIHNKLAHSIFITLKVIMTILSLFFSLSSIAFIALINFDNSGERLYNLFALISSFGAMLLQLLLYFLGLDRKIVFHNRFMVKWQSFFIQLSNKNYNLDAAIEECNKIYEEENNIWENYIVSI